MPHSCYLSRDNTYLSASPLVEILQDMLNCVYTDKVTELYRSYGPVKSRYKSLIDVFLGCHPFIKTIINLSALVTTEAMGVA